MIETQNVSVRFGSRTLYDNVNLKFTDGNCYGLIGANGTGKNLWIFRTKRCRKIHIPESTQR